MHPSSAASRQSIPTTTAFITRVLSIVIVALAVGALWLGSTATQPVDAAPSAQRAVTCSGATYKVVAGDGWYLIAQKNGVTMSALLTANNATASSFLSPGQIVCLPSGATPPSTTTPTTVVGAPTTPTPPPSAVTIQQFPMQGSCNFIDTWGAPRSGGRSHEGVDLLGKAGLYIYAVSDGVLSKQYLASTSSLSGNGWRLTRADGTYFFYAHLSGFAPGLTVGSTVKAGQIIGYNGMTGNAGTPHLHFEVHPGGGAAVNPTPIVRAVDGCKTTAVPPQPGGVTPPTTTPPTTTPPTTTPPTTTPPTTTPPVTTTPPPINVANGTRWTFTAPTVALDTAGSKLAARTKRTVSIANLNGIPANTLGVMVRLSARNVSANGYVSVHPCNVDGLTTSSLSIRPGRLNATTTSVAIASSSFCVTANVATDVRVEVIGVQAADGSQVKAMVSRRALDTRTANKPIAANGTRSVSPSALGVPLGTRAVTVTVTIVRPTAAGSIGIAACGGSPWILAYSAGQLQVISGVVRMNDSGLCITTTSEAHVVVDVTAQWNSSTGVKQLTPSTPARAYDSRAAAAIDGTTRTVNLANIPAGTTHVGLTVTLVGGSTSGALFAWPCNQPKPTASVGAVEAGSTATVQIVLAGTQLCLSSTANLHVTVDVTARG